MYKTAGGLTLDIWQKAYKCIALKYTLSHQNILIKCVKIYYKCVDWKKKMKKKKCFESLECSFEWARQHSEWFAHFPSYNITQEFAH